MIAGKTRSVHRRIEDDRRHNDERASPKRGKNAASIDIAEDMLETPSVRDTLAKLNPRTKPGEKNRAIVEANREEIYAARDRGCTWAEISQALAEAGIAIGPNTLRLTMSEQPRDLKKYPRKMLAERKPRQSVQQSSIKGNRCKTHFNRLRKLSFQVRHRMDGISWRADYFSVHARCRLST